MKVGEIMQKAYIIDKDISFSEAARLMSRRDIGSLLFVVKGKIKGIVTDGDVLKHFGHTGKISEIMSKNVVTVDVSENVDIALEILRKHKIKHLPIVEKGKLLGIVSLTDIAQHVKEIEGDFFL